MAFVYGDTPNADMRYLDASGIPDIETPLVKQNNLSDLESVSSAILNLGLAKSGIYIISN